DRPGRGAGGAAPTPRGGANVDAAVRLLGAGADRKVASFTRQGLEEEGYAVEVAPDGATALDLVLASPPFDLVVLDVMLPRQDGFSVLKRMRERRIETPVLFLTARDTVPDRVAGQEEDRRLDPAL